MVNTFWAVFIPVLFNPFGVYLARSAQQRLRTQRGAGGARVDGAGELRAYVRVGLRMLGPGFVTVFLFQLTAIWNNFFLPMVMLSDQQLYPLSLGLYTWNSSATVVARVLPAGRHRLAARRRTADRRVRDAAALLGVGPDRRECQVIASQPPSDPRPRAALAMAERTARQVRSGALDRLTSSSTSIRVVLDDFTTPAARRALADAELLVTGWGCPPSTAASWTPRPGSAPSSTLPGRYATTSPTPAGSAASRSPRRPRPTPYPSPSTPSP